MTVTGLNTVNLSAMNTFQQFILFLMIMLGSAILVSIAVIFVRLKAFERRFQSIVDEEKRKKKERGGGLRRAVTGSILRRQTGLDMGGGTLKGRPRKTNPGTEDGVNGKLVEKSGSIYPITEESLKGSPQESSKESAQNSPKESAKNGHAGRGPLTIDTNVANNKPEEGDKHGENCVTTTPNRIIRGRGVSFVQSPTTPPKIAPLARVFSMKGVGARQDLMNNPVKVERRETPPTPLTAVPEHEESWDWSQLIHRFRIPRGNVGRNSQFSGLSPHDRWRLGGVEYQTLTVLVMVVPLYFISWQFLGALGLGAWTANNARDLTDANGLNPW